jgi:hypothetical protein
MRTDRARSRPAVAPAGLAARRAAAHGRAPCMSEPGIDAFALRPEAVCMGRREQAMRHAPRRTDQYGIFTLLVATSFGHTTVRLPFCTWAMKLNWFLLTPRSSYS